ncbi:hypothetical protein LJB42_004016 [Komagataella kurtzmanii]|nr:hypothetical protein LJB42_004016 [Komagataella kurtzmanii]
MAKPIPESTLEDLGYFPKGTPVTSDPIVNGIPFRTTFWPVPEGVTVKGRILFVHGLAEHALVYTEPMDFFSQSGYECFFYDQRGAGLTAKYYKNIGVTNSTYVFDDLEAIIELNLKEAEQYHHKLFLIGHSMGGAIVSNYAIIGKHRDEISGIVACAPLIETHPKTSPNIILEYLVRGLVYVIPNHKFNSKLNIDFITSDKGYTEFLLQDRLSDPIGSLILFRDAFYRGRRLLTPEFYTKFKKDLPYLVIHGAKDYCCSGDSAKKFVDLINKNEPTAQQSITLYEEGKHSLLLEKEELRYKVYNDLLKFLDDQA